MDQTQKFPCKKSQTVNTRTTCLHCHKESRHSSWLRKSLTLFQRGRNIPLNRKNLWKSQQFRLKKPTIPTKQTKSLPRYVEPKILECQPISSKIQMEDLVMDNKDHKTSTSNSTRSFWDRPIPKPQYDWPHDPRMPAEWNIVIVSMRAHEGTCYLPRGEHYWQPLDDKISEPEEFTAHYHPTRQGQLRRQASVWLKPWQNNADRDFKALRTRFKEPRPRKPPTKHPGTVPDLKGKGKACDKDQVENDYSQQCQ